MAKINKIKAKTTPKTQAVDDRKIKIIQAEPGVPKALALTLQELDPKTGANLPNKKTEVIPNDIEEDDPAKYET